MRQFLQKLNNNNHYKFRVGHHGAPGHNAAKAVSLVDTKLEIEAAIHFTDSQAKSMNAWDMQKIHEYVTMSLALVDT